MSQEFDDRTPARRGNCDAACLEESQELQPALAAGRFVEVRGERWRIRDARRHERCASLHLIGAAPSNAGRPKTILVPFDRPLPVLSAVHLRRVGRRRWIRALRSHVARLSGTFGLEAAAAASLALLDWQLEPAMALLGGDACRALLADEVGLGKTVQAGLALAECLARNDLGHALVLVPAGLRDQWAGELRSRFGIEALVMDAVALARARASTLASVNPWATAPVVIASLDLVKRPEVLPGPAAIVWDLLVVDEAHAAASAPERHRAVFRLARLARRLLLLTATPHAGDEAAFRALCDLGRHEGEPPITLFRRTRQSVGVPVTRRVHLLRVRASDSAPELHALLSRYINRVLLESSARGDRAARLAMVVLAKRAFSSTQAFAVSLERREALLGTAGAGPAAQLQLPLDDAAGDLDGDDRLPDDILSSPGLDDVAAEREWLRHLADMARSLAAGDRKMAALARMVRRVREPVVVFTEYRDTLDHAAAVISGVCPVAILHGGLDRAERRDVLRRFATGDVCVLVATDVGGQGLNLQESCRLIVSVELPWNPMRLEQRIGRVDRLGQARRVHAVHLVAAGTAEEYVLARLVVRLTRARVAVGGAGEPLGDLTEEAISRVLLDAQEDADHVLEGLFAPLAERQPAPGGGVEVTAARSDGEALEPPFILPPRSSARRAADERARLEQTRRLRGGGAWHDRNAPREVPVTSVSRRRLAPFLGPGRPAGAAIVAFYAASIVDRRGALVEECLWPLAVACPGREAGTSLETRAGIEAWLRQHRGALDQAARGAASERIVAITPAHRVAAGALQAREAAIRAALIQERARRDGPFQAGLFDRRAIHAADRGRAEIDRLLDQSAPRDDVSRDLCLSGEPELSLLLIVRG